MVIRCLEIQNLRNLTSVRLELDARFNYFVGANGAGKTSILEAVHLLARGRSFRDQSTAPIIAEGQDGLVVRALLEDGSTLGLARKRTGKTRLRIDQQPVRKLSASASLLPLQLLLPNLSDLVFGSPIERRRYLDWGLFHVKPSYIGALRDLQAANRQRNAILRSWDGPHAHELLEVWTDAFCRHAAMVDEYRSEYAKELLPFIERALEELCVGFEVKTEYRNGWGEENLAKMLRETLAKDVKSGTTGLGPHRADLLLKLQSGSVRAKLSRGQGKLVATALILAQARLLQAQRQRKSLFLVDELGAEMDGEYLARMLRLLNADGFQVIATSTQPLGQQSEASLSEQNLTLFHVKQGEVYKFQSSESGETVMAEES